jgi:nucleoside-diphosphate-sugar epimerase
MRVLVTGATGFVGNHVINKLLQQGHEIIASSPDQFKAASCKWFSEVRFIEYSFDIKLEERNLFELFERPNILIHLAWQGLPQYEGLFHIETNLISHFYFLRNLICNGLNNITIAGTCLEYGLQSGCLHEDLVSSPTIPYALAKDTLRKLVQAMASKYEFSLKWVRLFYVYGPGQHSNSLLPLLQSAIVRGDREFKMSGGEQLRDYLPIEEVVENIVFIALQNEVTGIINCCSGRPISIRRFVESFIAEQNANIKLVFDQYPYPEYEPMAFWGDNKKLKKILGQ